MLKRKYAPKSNIDSGYEADNDNDINIRKKFMPNYNKKIKKIKISNTSNTLNQMDLLANLISFITF